MYIREADADIRLTVDGRAIMDSWATFEGGELEAEDSKTRPGGLGKEISVGGLPTRGDITLTTQFTDVLAGVHPWLESRVGPGLVKVGVSYLNHDGTPNGQGFTRSGTLKSARVPDQGGGSETGMYTVLVSCDESGT